MGFGIDDNINPSHYKQGNIECIDALESATVGKTGIEAVCVANVIKYLWRYEDKNGLEDIEKAKWYLDWLIKVVADSSQKELIERENNSNEFNLQKLVRENPKLFPSVMNLKKESKLESYPIGDI